MGFHKPLNKVFLGGGGGYVGGGDVFDDRHDDDVFGEVDMGKQLSLPR